MHLDQTSLYVEVAVPDAQDALVRAVRVTAVSKPFHVARVVICASQGSVEPLVKPVHVFSVGKLDTLPRNVEFNLFVAQIELCDAMFRIAEHKDNANLLRLSSVYNEQFALTHA